MTLYHIQSDGAQTEVSEGNNPRLALSYNDTNYQILLKYVFKIDGGTYMMSFTNHFGVKTMVFTVTVISESIVSRKCAGGQ